MDTRLLVPATDDNDDDNENEERSNDPLLVQLVDSGHEIN